MDFLLKTTWAGLMTASLGAVALHAQAPVPNTLAAPSYHLEALSLGGTTRTDQWLAMNQFNYEQSYYGYAGALATRAWQHAMKPNFPSAQSTAVFNKTTLTSSDGSPRQANGYPAMEGIYTLFTRTPFVLTESRPLADLKTVAFQIYLTTGGSDTSSSDSTAAYGVDGDLFKQPLLTVTTTTGTQSFSATLSTLYKSIPYEFEHTGGDVEETFTIYENYRLFQWDLSSVTGNILGFDISFATYEHVSLRSIQLDQSTAVMAAVPEPAAAALWAGAIFLGCTLFRQRFRGRGQPAVRS